MRDAITRPQRQCNPNLIDAVDAHASLDIVDVSLHRNAREALACELGGIIEERHDFYAKLWRTREPLRDFLPERPGARNGDTAGQESAPMQRAQQKYRGEPDQDERRES